MKNINDLLKDINDISKISFKLENELGVLYETPSFKHNEEVFEDAINVNNYEYRVFVRTIDKNALPLLKYYISKVISEIEDEKTIFIKEILLGKKVVKEKVQEKYPWLLKKIGVLNIYVNSKLSEAYELLKEGYEAEKIICLCFEGKILIIGNLEDIQDHAISIKDTLESSIYCKSLIYYSYVSNYKELSLEVEKSNIKIEVAIKYNSEEPILSEKNMMFEELIDNINNTTKDEIINKYKKGFEKIDEEMIKTIDIFFKNGLNLSEASKELFIHRNTLIYRLDKIQKCTNFDLRNFNEATIFKIIYTLWKEREKNI